METSLKTGFAQIFSCCPKNLSRPKFGGAAAPLAPPARTPMPPSLYCRHACEVVDCEQSLMSFFFAKLLHAKPKHASSELSREPREMRASRLNPLCYNKVVVCNRAG